MQEIENIESLKRRKNEFLNELKDPLVENKRDILNQIHLIDNHLLELNAIPYFCTYCGYKHRKGRIYNEHKKFAKIPIKFPAIKMPKLNIIIRTKMVGIYPLNSKKIVENLEPYTKLDMVVYNETRIDPTITFYYLNKPIGYLYRKHNFKTIWTAMRNGYTASCYFIKYIPKSTRIYNMREGPGRDNNIGDGTTTEERDSADSERKIIFWTAEHAIIEIYLTKRTQFMQYLKGLLELLELGHPNLEPAFRKLGPDVLHYLDERNPKHKKIINFIQQFQKVHVKSNSLNIIL